MNDQQGFNESVKKYIIKRFKLQEPILASPVNAKKQLLQQAYGSVQIKYS